jgi:hypothetical protein
MTVPRHPYLRELNDDEAFQLIVSCIGLLRDRKRVHDLLIVAQLCLRKVHLTHWELRYDELNKRRIRNVRDQLRFILRDFGPI